MASANDEIETILDSMIEIGHKSLKDNIKPKNNSFGEEWDSLIKSFLNFVEADQDLNGLIECLTQLDIETYDDVEFQPYHEFIPKYRIIAFKVMEILILSTDDEEIIKRHKVILEEIKKRFG